MVLLVLEVCSWGALSLFHRRPITWSYLRHLRQEVARVSDPGSTILPSDADAGRPEYVDHHMIHPYLGFVWNLAAEGGEEFTGFFPTAKQLLVGRDPATLRVALMGGSVAAQLHRDAVLTLIRELERIPRFSGKTIEVFPIAMGGYKQPQQLIALTYLLSLGAEFDVVIELDGFNEIALPMRENIPHGIFPFYPRGWQYFAGAADLAVQRLAGEVSYHRAQRLTAARFFDGPILRYSLASGLLWEVIDGWYKGKIVKRIEMSQHADAQKQTRPVITGPRRPYASTGAIIDDLAREWKQSSLQMDRIARSAGMLYFHFLQPNQYVPGSKRVMSARERQIGITPKGYGEWIPGGYPALQAQSRELLERGVRYHDLTGIFLDVPEQMYSDSCCHLTIPGYEHLARAIVQLMAADIGRDSAPTVGAGTTSP